MFRLGPILCSSYILLATTLPAFSQNRALITSGACPYNCATEGLDSTNCRDWQLGQTCYVENFANSKKHKRASFKLCVRDDRGVIRVRERCKTALGERSLAIEDFRGDSGPKGDTGINGSVRVYGDGSAGEKTVSVSGIFNDSNPQYANFTVAAGVTLTVQSGTVIRCTGSFTNHGTIQVLAALRDQPRFSENGLRTTSGKSGGQEAPGGAGGSALAEGVVKSFLRPGLSGGGNGYRSQAQSGGDGGGNFSVITKEEIVNGSTGVISADGEDAASSGNGGGGGGLIILASAESVSNLGTIRAQGGDGGALQATDPDLTGYGPGGGGGGGIVHLIAPTIAQSGSIDLSGGAGSAAGGAGGITGVGYIGGGGGGASGGDGGDGGTVNPSNIGNNSTTAGADGGIGQSISTIADPTSLL